MRQQYRSRLKLIGVFLLFFAPLALAYVLYYGMHGMITGGATNKGILLTPVVPLPTIKLADSGGALTSTDVLREQWTFLQVAPKGCGPACRKSLRETRQIWVLLHDERVRVQRVLFVGGGTVTPPAFEKQPRLEVYSGMLAPLAAFIESHEAGRPGTVYLIDPHGNWVLYYPPEQNGKALFEDTKHLLHLSQIG